MQPLVPGFTIIGELSSSATGSAWAAVRDLDDHRFLLRIVPVAGVTEARTQVAHLMGVLRQVQNEHVVRLHNAIALADGTLALVFDQVTGVSLAHVLGARGPLTPGETVTTVSPLLGALADLHAAGIAHGDLAPANVLFSADGRPLISGLGVARLLRRPAVPADGSPGFRAPELVAGGEVSPSSDVYAMAAIGWYCLVGAPPSPAATRPSSTMLRPEVPPRLFEVLGSCLSADPAARPSAAEAAVEVFDAAPAESVRLASVSDPATEITRRIRASAASAPTLATPSGRKRPRDVVAVSVVALLMAVSLGGAMTWFLRRPPVPVQPTAVPSVAQPAPRSVASAKTPRSMTDVVTAPDSPRIAPAELLQALVGSRALAYLARNSALLDLVYAAGAPGAAVDQGNIGAALRNGGTYLGLAFVVKDVAFLDGTSGTARIRATVVTPTYQTGQPDGRKVPHPPDIVGPSVFALRLTPDGWRILALTAG